MFLSWRKSIPPPLPSPGPLPWSPFNNNLKKKQRLIIIKKKKEKSPASKIFFEKKTRKKERKKTWGFVFSLSLALGEERDEAASLAAFFLLFPPGFVCYAERERWRFGACKDNLEQKKKSQVCLFFGHAFMLGSSLPIAPPLHPPRKNDEFAFFLFSGWLVMVRNFGSGGKGG